MGLNNMLFFVFSYLAIFLYLLGEILIWKRTIKSESSRKNLRELRAFWIILAIMYALIGVFTNDPLVTDLICKWKNICLPPTYEWIIYIGIVSFLVYIVLLRPMNSDIEILKNESKKVEGRLSKVEGTLEEVRDNTRKLVDTHLKN